jgi:hypothetical protein
MVIAGKDGRTLNIPQEVKIQPQCPTMSSTLFDVSVPTECMTIAHFPSLWPRRVYREQQSESRRSIASLDREELLLQYGRIEGLLTEFLHLIRDQLPEFLIDMSDAFHQ